MPRQNMAQLVREENHKQEQVQMHCLISVEIPTVPPTLFCITDANYDIEFGGKTYLKFPCKMSDISVSATGSIDKATLSCANPSRTLMPYIAQYKGLRNQTVRVKKIYAKFLPKIYTMNEQGQLIDDSGPTTVLAPFGYTNPDYVSADSANYIEDVYSIDSYVADENTVTFQLDPRADFNVMLTRRRYTSNSCYWPKFKDPDTCGYVSNTTTGAGSAGFNLLTVGNHSVFSVGKYISIAGITGDRKITDINGAVLTLDTVLNATVSNAAISFTNCDKTLQDCVRHNNQRRFGGFPGLSGQRRISI